MADITMCSGDECPKKVTCYRFTAVACKYRQSFFFTPPFRKEDGFCDHYWWNDAVLVPPNEVRL